MQVLGGHRKNDISLLGIVGGRKCVGPVGTIISGEDKQGQCPKPCCSPVRCCSTRPSGCERGCLRVWVTRTWRDAGTHTVPSMHTFAAAN